MQWEEKNRRESTRVKLDLEKQYKEEKRNLLEEARLKMEEQLKSNNEKWEKKLLESKKEVRFNSKLSVNKNGEWMHDNYVYLTELIFLFILFAS